MSPRVVWRLRCKVTGDWKVLYDPLWREGPKPLERGEHLK